PPGGESKEAPRELMSYSIEPQRADAVKFFVGPKDFDLLTAIDPDVGKAIDFGMFTVIVVPLLRSLKWVNGYVGNYGWSIVILTMPFIFAFYALRSTAIELRGAPWFGWIHDLSAHDPYFVTPVLMGVSQVWQQRLAPAAGMDPIQQKMTMLMPVFFTFLFLWY